MTTELLNPEELEAASAPAEAAGGKDRPRPGATPRGLDRACTWSRESGPVRVRMKATLLALAGPPPPLPAREQNRRSPAQQEAELRWTAWAMRAGLTNREIMVALGVSKATCKRRLRVVRRELDRQIGDFKREEALAVEWETRLEQLRDGETPPPLTPERELALMEFAENVVRWIRDPSLGLHLAPAAPGTRGSKRGD